MSTPWLSLFQWIERFRPAQTEPSSAASALEPRQIPVSSACCHIWTEPSLPLCPETPTTVSTEQGRPGPKGFRHPQVISDAWRSQAGRCPDTRAGGRADLCLPENRPKPPSLLSDRGAGVGVLGSSRSGGEPPASEWARGCPWPRGLPRPAGRELWAESCWAGGPQTPNFAGLFCQVLELRTVLLLAILGRGCSSAENGPRRKW